MRDKNGWDKEISLPPGLDIPSIRKAIRYVEKEASEWIDIYFEQANVFSAVIGILGVRALDSFSVYEKHRNTDTAQQRFPDLRRKGAGDKPSANHSLESKGSKRPWAIQSHYDHPGWYILWRYLVDPTKSIDPDRTVILWRVDVVYLKKADWKYEQSSAGDSGGGRTHTFRVKEPASKLKGCAVYERPDLRLRGGKPVPKNGD
jgi:hypothetical protein